ncbi:prevent-host-death family protein [Rhodobacter sp. 140A]|uniref:Antitoxin n=1 Tax=bioreactor metagenome TaxID=1076179 RepID=A0A644UYB3_9ZZZZ|nr:prevent-host-death family protein [Rhodobacter sp. 140A]
MWTLQDAKNRFSAVVEAALAGQPQQVTRRGKPAVVVLSAADYARMQAAATAHRGSFAAHLRAFPKGGALPEDRPAVTPRDVAF